MTISRAGVYGCGRVYALYMRERESVHFQMDSDGVYISILISAAAPHRAIFLVNNSRNAFNGCTAAAAAAACGGIM